MRCEPSIKLQRCPHHSRGCPTIRWKTTCSKRRIDCLRRTRRKRIRKVRLAVASSRCVAMSSFSESSLICLPPKPSHIGSEEIIHAGSPVLAQHLRRSNCSALLCSSALLCAAFCFLVALHARWGGGDSCPKCGRVYGHPSWPHTR